MNAARMDYSRNINWSAAKSSDHAAAMRRQILRFVFGIRSEREGGVTRKQILAWFYGTPADFVEAAILDAVTRDEVNVCRTALVRRANARYVYEITDKGREALKARSEPSAPAPSSAPRRGS